MSFAAQFRRKGIESNAPRNSAPSVVHQVLRSPGQSLDSDARAFLEPRFGHDFGRVRVHADEQAAESAKSVGAKAYTAGQHLVFNHEAYQPNTPQGRELIAHELTHTIQQNQSVKEHTPLFELPPTDASENEADLAASQAVGGGTVAVNSRRTAGIQKSPDPLAPPHADLAESASPFLAAAIGSVTIDGFVTGKADISPANRDKLGKTAKNLQTLLTKYPGSSIQVTGHTDAIGKEENNQTLGQQRADSAQAALVEMGIPAKAIQTESKGETELLVKTQKAEPRNRRVDIRFQPSTGLANVLPDVSLKPPGPPSPAGNFGQPAPTIPPPYKYKPKVDPSPGSNLPDWFWKPLPAGPEKKGTSLDDVINSAAKKITSFLPKSIQEKAQGLVKDAIEKGITAGLDSALQGAGVDEKSRQAIGKATEAAIQQKLGGNK
jgi:outer membrane protein OmpA-like peptidoglycan-associated protein